MSGTIAPRLKRQFDRIIRPGGRGVVLLYHRVAHEVSDPYGLCVTPRQFEEHVQVVRKIGRPMRMNEFARAMRDRKLPDRAVAITFDDGYLDNLECAAPILDRYDVPALAFVTTGPGGREREYWWDELERIFLEPGEIPATLGLEMNGKSQRWDFGLDRMYTEEYRERHRGWRLNDPSTPTARHRAFRDIYELVKPLAVSLRDRVVAGLVGWAGIDRKAVRQSRRTMQPDQVKRMVDRGLMEVGAHTVHHPALPLETPEGQSAEVARSKETLQEWTGGEVSGFAYPFGLYNDSAVEATRRAGYSFACSSMYQEASPRTDLHLIPRIEAPAADGDTLARILRWQLR